MPSSANRRRLEVPTALYTRLEGEAHRRQTTAAALATALLAEALDRAERAASGGDATGESLRTLLADSANQTAELRAIRRELALALPHARANGVERAAPAANSTRTFDPQDWAGLRAVGPGGRGGAMAFKDALANVPASPALLEYLRLLLVSSLTQSESLRAEYLRQAEELRAQFAGSLPGQGVEGVEAEGSGGTTQR